MLNFRRTRLFLLHSRMVKRGTRRLRTLRGGGTTSYGFVSPPDFSRTVNNGLVASVNGPGAPTHVPAPYEGGGGLPGLSTGHGVSLQKGGGGGTHYGFNGGGLAGGNTAIATNCAFPQSGGSGQLNVPVGQSPLGTMAGGRRHRRRQQKNTRKNKSRRNKQSRRR
jgi:hypothetical protein